VATIDAIRTGIQTRLATLTDVRTEHEWTGPFNVSGTVAVAIVEFDGATYDAAFTGQADALNFKITMLVSKGSDRGGRTRLDAFLDPTPGSTTSVRTAVNGNLGGTVAFAVVTTATGYREYEISEIEKYPGVEFAVTVGT